MMKSKRRIVSMLTVLAMVLAMMPAMAFADAAETAKVSVTIADKGALVVTQEEVTVTDIDADGALTINETLYAAHEAVYEGGAAAGYASAMSGWGLSITKLWGDTSGSYGYYVNNASAWSLVDPVKDGDTVYAFVYADQTAWSDVYCFFDKKSVEAAAGEEVVLTLSYNGYDADWNTVVAPLAGATITVDGIATETVTDAEGNAVIKMEAGNHVISATAADKTLVPPVCIAEVAEAPAADDEADTNDPVVPEDPEQNEPGQNDNVDQEQDEPVVPQEPEHNDEANQAQDEPAADTESDKADNTPQTGDDFNLALYGFIALVALAAAALCLRRKTCK